jgi:hypothetical protein
MSQPLKYDRMNEKVPSGHELEEIVKKGRIQENGGEAISV